MVDIKPFRAIRYTQKAGNLSNLITQPWDKIDPVMQKEYYEKSLYNYCRLILPTEENRYQIVHQRIHHWIEEHIIEKDVSPSLFLCQQEYNLDGKTRKRNGLLVALRLYNYEENLVFPHETTFSAPKADRLNMLRTVQKDLEPIFLIYSDEENATTVFFNQKTKKPPAVEVEDELKVKHRLWQIADPEEIAFLQKVLQSKTLVITDGHHRYESAIAFRDEQRKQVQWTEESAFNFHMCYIVPVQDPGLTILPTHRLLKKIDLTAKTLESLGEHFFVQELDSNTESIENYLEIHKRQHAFCVYTGSKTFGLLLKNKETPIELGNTSKDVSSQDVTILRDLVFKTIMKTGDLKIGEDILYERSMRITLEKVDKKEAKVAFLVNPLDSETVWRIAQKSERFPEKSTDFYPKPASGLLMMDISPEEEL
jgi:uncharacterized protein (DUF1015 family)